MRRLAAFALVPAAVLALAACGGSSSSSQSSPPTTTAAAPPTQSKPAKPAGGQSAPAVPTGAGRRCISVTDGLRHKILTNVVLVGAKLRHVEAVQSPLVPEFYFVSGTVDGSGTHDQLATWATTRLDGRSPVYAVDSFAALISTYAAATQKNPDLSTRSPGSFQSRICSFGPKANVGLDAPPSGVGNAPATR
jgi:hypothetical protein